MKENKIRHTEIKGLLKNKVTGQKITQWLTSERMFLTYRYKKQSTYIHPKTGKFCVPQPYIRNEDASEHRYALTFAEWQKIIQTYWEIVVEHLIDSVDFRMPLDLGLLQMCKYKPKKISRRGKHDDLTFYRNLPTLGYRPFIIWRKKHASRFGIKGVHIFNLTKTLWRKVHKALVKDPTIIFKYPDIRSDRKISTYD